MNLMIVLWNSLKSYLLGSVVEIKISNEVVFYDEIPTSAISKIGAEAMREEWLMPENEVWNTYMEEENAI